MGEQGGDLTLEEVDYVTRNFRNLQGLRLLPALPALVLWAGSESGVLRGGWWLWAWLASLAVAVVGVPAVGVWYRRRYGDVRPAWDGRRTWAVSGAVLGIITLGVVLFALAVTGRWPDTAPVSVSGAILGAAFAAMAFATGPVGRRIHPWTQRAGLALLVASLVPLGLVAGYGGDHPFNADGVIALLLAVVLLVGALDTHRALVRFLPARGDAPSEP